MNILTAVAVLQLLLVVKGGEVPEERKRVGCFYEGTITKRYGALLPEEIDATICTHLTYAHGTINNETQEISFKPLNPKITTGGEGYVPRLLKLKAANPDLKLNLHIFYRNVELELLGEPSRSNLIQNGVKWLNGSGFDGLEITVPDLMPENAEKMADLLCDMKNEFDKYGFSVTTSLREALEIPRESLRKITRCCDYVELVTHHRSSYTHRILPMSIIKSMVETFVERGLPARNILIMLPSFGSIFILDDPNETGVGALICGPGNDDEDLMRGSGIHNKELIRKMNDSSLGWTFRRDNETGEPYAFTTTGLWTSYEDNVSMEFKARYAMEKGLGGINIVMIDTEDDEGIGGQGRFPLTRATFNAFRRGNESSATSN